MPETFVRIKWPGGREETVYSPSSIIGTYFESATELSLSEFETRCGQALDHASQRVRETYGYACSSAMAEKHRILSVVKQLQATHPDQPVQILTISS
jgi:uncharacterized repeat protein (TIGR04042 family)